MSTAEAAAAPTLRTLDELPELLTRQELSRFTGLSVPTLARWAVEKTGPKVTKLGAAARYRKADVLAWLDAAAAAS